MPLCTGAPRRRSGSHGIRRASPGAMCGLVWALAVSQAASGATDVQAPTISADQLASLLVNARAGDSDAARDLGLLAERAAPGEPTGGDGDIADPTRSVWVLLTRTDSGRRLLPLAPKLIAAVASISHVNRAGAAYLLAAMPHLGEPDRSALLALQVDAADEAAPWLAIARAKNGDTAAVPVVILLLGSSDPWLRLWSAVALGEAGTVASSAIPALMDALEGATGGLLGAAYAALDTLSPLSHRYAREIATHLSSGDPTTRYTAVSVLSNSDEPPLGAGAALCRFLREPLPPGPDQVEAAPLLGRLASTQRENAEYLGCLRYVLHHTRDQELGDAAACALAQEAAGALFALGPAAAPAHVELRAALGDERVTSIICAGALAQVGDRSGEEVLSRALESADPSTARAGAYGLSCLAATSEGARTALRARLQSDDEVVAACATVGLSRAREKEGLALLPGVLDLPDSLVRLAAADAMLEVGLPGAEALLRDMLDSGRWKERRDAERVLHKYGL